MKLYLRKKQLQQSNAATVVSKQSTSNPHPMLSKLSFRDPIFKKNTLPQEQIINSNRSTRTTEPSMLKLKKEIRQVPSFFINRQQYQICQKCEINQAKNECLTQQNEFLIQEIIKIKKKQRKIESKQRLSSNTSIKISKQIEIPTQHQKQPLRVYDFSKKSKSFYGLMKKTSQPTSPTSKKILHKQMQALIEDMRAIRKLSERNLQF